MNTRFIPLLAVGQGLFYLATGIWPMLSRRSFEMVTGPKADFWLVRTAGTLITVVGGVLLWAGIKKDVQPQTRLIATGCAAGLAAVDVIYTARGRISPVYLLDAAAEVGLVAMWLLEGVSRDNHKDHEGHEEI